MRPKSNPRTKDFPRLAIVFFALIGVVAPSASRAATLCFLEEKGSDIEKLGNPSLKPEGEACKADAFSRPGLKNPVCRCYHARESHLLNGVEVIGAIANPAYTAIIDAYKHGKTFEEETP